MPLKMITPMVDVTDKIYQGMHNAEKVIIDTLCYVGETCINEARENGSYVDRTGNLRSSIGYAVVVYGKIYQSNSVQQTKGGAGGLSSGQSFLQQKANEAKDTNKISLVVTAGMNYAEYVEAKGYNVLTSAELLADTLVKEILLKLGFKLR